MGTGSAANDNTRFAHRHHLHGKEKSGRGDSNSRPPAPKAGALARLRYAPQCAPLLPMLPVNAGFGNHGSL